MEIKKGRKRSTPKAKGIVGKRKRTPSIDDAKEELPDEDKLEGAVAHKQELAKIAEKDPEFYKFLREQEADLLEFNESDAENSDDDNSEGGSDFEMAPKADEKTKSEKIRTDRDGRTIVDGAFVENLHNTLRTEEQVSPSSVTTAIELFAACVARVGADVEPPKYAINDEHVFESVVRMCFDSLGKALYSLLVPTEVKAEVDDEADDNDDEVANERSAKSHVKCSAEKKFRRWKKHSSLAKRYLQSLLLFQKELQSPDVVVCTVRAMTDLSDLFVYFNKLSRNLIKLLVRIWSRKTLECRCAALVALCKLVRLDKKLFPAIIKGCYLGYVSNVREVSAETWPLISFMQKGFAELCAIEPAVAYQYAFVYIRQTAIHVRNGMIARRKDLVQTVYNWQFIQCLYLWAQVVSKAHRSSHTEHPDPIAELAYPLCQITIAAMKLFPSLRYFPLRLHCIRILLLVQVNCGLFVPTLSLAVQMLDELLLWLRKKPSKGKGSTKGIDINCLLKGSASQMDDAGYRQSAVEGLFKVQLEAAYVLRNSIAFSDIIVPLEPTIKRFVKESRNVEFAKLFRSLESKLSEHAKRGRLLVASRQVDLRDPYCVASLEAVLDSKDSSFVKFYDSWQNVWKLQQQAKEGIVESTATKRKERGSEVKKKKKKNSLQ